MCARQTVTDAKAKVKGEKSALQQQMAGLGITSADLDRVLGVIGFDRDTLWRSHDFLKAKHPYGVLYQGEFETPTDGTARAVRIHARALAATGLPLALRSFSGVVVNADGVAEPVYAAGMPDEVQAEVGHLLDPSIAEFRPVIKHVVIRSAEHLRQILMPKGAIPLLDTLEEQIKLRAAIESNTIVHIKRRALLSRLVRSYVGFRDAGMNVLAAARAAWTVS